MADKKIKQKEPKVLYEREYIVPLRSEWLKVAKHKRATRAVKELKRFLARHMKIYDRDLRKIKIENDLNNELRFRGMRKPPASIKVKAIKLDNDTVRAELVDIPAHVKFARLREEKINKEAKKDEKKVEEQTKVEKKVEEKEEDTKKEHDAKEKEEASREEGLAISKEEAKEQKHVTKLEKPTTQNMGYKRAQKGR